MCKVCRAARGVGEVMRKPILGKYFPAAYTVRPVFRGLRIRPFRPPHISRYTPLYLMSSLAADGYKKQNPNAPSYKSRFGFAGNGGPGGIRTLDLCDANAALSIMERIGVPTNMRYNDIKGPIFTKNDVCPPKKESSYEK